MSTAPLLTVIGCRAGMPADGWPSSSYLLDADGQRVLFDCGPGAATALSRSFDPTTLTAVFLSHRHLDHCLDLVVLGKQLVAHNAGGARIPLYVPPGVGDVLRRLNHLLPVADIPESDLDHVFDIAFEIAEYVAETVIPCGPLTVEPVAMRHRIASHGFRVATSDGVFAYSGDTGPTPAFERLADGAELLLVEATLDHTDTSGHGHLSASEAGRAGADAGARSLVLTHLIASDPSWIVGQRAAAAEHFAGPVFVATPAAQFLIDPASANRATRQPSSRQQSSSRQQQEV